MDRQSARIRVDGHDNAIVKCIEAFVFQQCEQTTTSADIVPQHFPNVGIALSFLVWLKMLFTLFEINIQVGG